MASALCLLILLASLTVWQSAADDPCDSEECLAGPERVCAANKETGNMVLFADECVLRCTNCRMTTEFKKVNSSLCGTGTAYISVCPDFPIDHSNEKTKTADPDDDIMVLGVDIGQDGSVGYEDVPQFFRNSPPLPLPLLSMGSELLRRLLMSSQPDQRPPPSPPGDMSLITADIKVDVTINMGAPLSPRAARLGAPPPLSPLMMAPPHAPLLVPPPPPPPPPQVLQLRLVEPRQPVAVSSAPQGARSAAAAVASVVALTVAALHF